jgi:PPOX class probable F420-dependent enzyme
MTVLSNEVRDFLNEVYFAVVATIAPDGMPHQTVMWYLPDGDDLILNTPENSLKHKHLLRDSRISVCVEDGFRYVTLIGTVKLADDPGRALYGKLGERYMSTLGQRSNARPPSGRTAELLSRDRITLRMKIERVISSGLG